MFYKITFKLLSDYSPKIIQELTVFFLSCITPKYLGIYIRPQNNKICWKNCAKIFIKVGFPSNSLYINELLIWLQDMNWPGAQEIFDYLSNIHSKDILKYFDIALKNAISTNDEDWVYSLSRLYDKSFSKHDLLDKNIIDKMRKIVNNY